MTQNTVKNFVDEIYSKRSKRNCATNKFDVYHIDDIWSLDVLDLEGYGIGNNKKYTYVSVAINIF